MNNGIKNEGPEEKKFMDRLGRVNLGSDGLDEETATTLNNLIEDLEQGKDLGDTLESEIAQGEELLRRWDTQIKGE